jgi:hypothetical protein
MNDTIAYRIGNLKVVVRDDLDMIEALSKNLQLAHFPYVTADSSEINNMNDLFKGLA